MENEYIDIIEVGPRDGLQSQPTILSTEAKLEFVQRLIDAGTKRIEVVSFVNPKKVPQMADAEDVVRQLPRVTGVDYIGLVLNLRGFERAVAAGLSEVNSAVVTTETFSQRNQGMSSNAMLETIAHIARESHDAQIKFSVTVSAAFGCPFEGPVAESQVAGVVRRLVDMGITEIALADTIGVAVPSAVDSLIKRVSPLLGNSTLRMHFHNTRNTAIANVYAALLNGVKIFDTSCGGLGGCPFAPGATGNVGTEDVLYLLENMGLRSSARLREIIATTKWLERMLNAPMPAMVSRASVYPPVAA